MHKLIRNKLTLRKDRTFRKKMANNYNTPPNNQEALVFNEDSDFDDLDLTEITERDSDHLPAIDIAFKAVNEIDVLMKKRFSIAKAREGLVYGRHSDQLPPFCNVNLRCKPNLQDTTNNKEFEEKMDKLIKETRDYFISQAIGILDGMFSTLKEEMTTIRRKAKDQIGTGKKAAGEARTLMYKKLGEMRDKEEKELAAFKAEIRYKPTGGYSWNNNSTNSNWSKRRNKDYRQVPY